MAQTGDSGSPSSNVGNVLCAAVQTLFTEFRSQQNINRLKLRHTGHSLM